MVGAIVGEQTEPEKSVSEVGDRVMLDGESGGVSEAAVGDGAVMMGDVGACSSRVVVECGANGSSSFDVDSVVDIGCVVELNMTVEEIVKSVTCLNVQQKYKLLTEHFVPTSMFKFPDSVCNRSFQIKWLEQYPWLVYSKALDGGFCKYCALFAKDRSKCNVLVNKPFKKWVKVSKIMKNHASNTYHINALADAQAFLQSVERPENNINVRIDTQRARNIMENRHILKCCVEGVLFCGRQCIALRGDKEALNQTGNPGNFFIFFEGFV